MTEVTVLHVTLSIMSGFNLGEWRSLEEEAGRKRGTHCVFMILENQPLHKVPFTERAAGGTNKEQDCFSWMGVWDPKCESQESYIQTVPVTPVATLLGPEPGSPSPQPPWGPSSLFSPTENQL